MRLEKFTLEYIIYAFTMIFIIMYTLKIQVVGVKLHYIIGIILVFLLTIKLAYKSLRIPTEFIWFFIISEMFSFLGYLVFNIVSYDEFTRVLFIQFMFISNFLVLVIVYNFFDYEKVFKTLLMAGFFNSFFVLNDIFKMISTGLFVRYTANFEDPNYVNLLFLLYLSALLYFYEREKILIFKIILLLLSLVYITGIFLTFSRSGYIATILFLLVYLLSKKRSIVYYIKFIFIFIMLLVFVSYIVVSLNIFESIIAMLEWRFTSPDEVKSGFSRVNEIMAGINFLSEKFPISLIGMGLGTSEVNSFFSMFFINTDLTPRIHNTYVSVFIENGILAFILFVYIITHGLKRVKKSNYSAYVYPVYIANLVLSIFVWQLYFLPFYLVLIIPYLRNKNIITNSLGEYQRWKKDY